MRIYVFSNLPVFSELVPSQRRAAPDVLWAAPAAAALGDAERFLGDRKMVKTDALGFDSRE